MARKKKVEEPKVETAQETPKGDIHASGIQNIGYQGSVTVKVMHGNKVVKTREYHNSGMPQLFKFLCAALAGNYSEALRPCKIKLFYYPDASETMPPAFNWTNAFLGDASIQPKAVTPFIVYDSTPIMRKVKDAEAAAAGEDSYYYTTTFHFRIPFTLISDTIIHMIGFFPNNVYAGTEVDAAAYYLFTTEDGQE